MGLAGRLYHEDLRDRGSAFNPGEFHPLSDEIPRDLEEAKGRRSERMIFALSVWGGGGGRRRRRKAGEMSLHNQLNKDK